MVNETAFKCHFQPYTPASKSSPLAPPRLMTDRSVCLPASDAGSRQRDNNAPKCKLVTILDRVLCSTKFLRHVFASECDNQQQSPLMLVIILHFTVLWRLIEAGHAIPSPTRT